MKWQQLNAQPVRYASVAATHALFHDVCAQTSTRVMLRATASAHAISARKSAQPDVPCPRGYMLPRCRQMRAQRCYEAAACRNHMIWPQRFGIRAQEMLLMSDALQRVTR